MSETASQVTQLASLQMSVEQIELALDIDEDGISASPELTKAFRKGRALGMVKICKTLMREVEDGSVQAAKLMFELANANEPEYIDEG